MNENISRINQEGTGTMYRFYIEDFCSSMYDAFHQYCNKEASKTGRRSSVVAEETLAKIGIKPKTFTFWLNANSIINKLDNPDNIEFQKASLPDCYRVGRLCETIGNREPIEYIEKFLSLAAETETV